MSSDETGFEIRDSTVVAEDTDAPLVLASRCDEPEDDSARSLFLSDAGSDLACSGALADVAAGAALTAWLRAKDSVELLPSSAYSDVFNSLLESSRA